MTALSGLRILDLTRVISGPYATQLLADLGAEVIKVEPPGEGESTRRLLEHDPELSLHGMGAYFITLNRNKKSLTLNLKSSEGLAIFHRLAAISDVVVDNFSVGVTARLGIDHQTLSVLNPRLVTCSITGFGETGPHRDWTAFDMAVQAISGLMSITGTPDGPPVRSGIPLADLGTGLMAAVGILSALFARQQTGRGQHIDLAMLDSQVSLLNYMATAALMSSAAPQREGNAHFVHVPYDSYQASDGWLVIAVIGDNFWQGVVRALDIPEVDTVENQALSGRQKNRAAIDHALSDIIKTNTRDHWIERLRAERVPCAPVNDLKQALDNPQLLSRQMVAEVFHPDGGSAHIPGNPIKLSDTPTGTYAPPPLIGQHTAEILRALLSMEDATISSLRDSGVI